MRLFSKAPDGGANSGVTAYFLIEWKSLFSIALLRFDKGTREAFHEHAFNAVTLWLKGEVWEHAMVANGHGLISAVSCARLRFAAGDWKFTPRKRLHQIYVEKPAWALTFRGPWVDRWREWRPNRGLVTLTHGRVEV